MTSDSSLQALLYARYRQDVATATSASDHVLDTLLGHRTVRAYLPDPVVMSDIDCAIAAAQSAPSSSNLQLWNVISIVDPERKARIARLCNNQKHILAAPLLLVWIVDLSRLRRLTEIEGTTADGLDYLELFLTGTVDVSLAAQNAVVALESKGYGTCYIGSMRSNPVDVTEELGLPQGSFGVFGLTVGREDTQRPASVKPRLAPGAVHHRETYQRGGVDGHVSNYNRVMQTFQAEQGMQVVDWSLKSAERVANASALKNRDRLRGYLERLGFSFN